MIVITGATGAFGSAVVQELLRKIPAGELSVSVRDPQKAAELAERGVRVRRGDFGDPASLAAAFEGADRVLVTSVNSLGEEAVAQHTAAARAAAEAGAGRIFYTAHQNTALDSPFAAAPDHAATEERLAQIGAPWTSLRNGFYAHTVGHPVHGAAEAGELALPEDGPVSWTAREDLAAGAATLVAAGFAGNDGPCFDGPTPPLTAAEAVTFDDVAEMMSAITGKTIRRVTIDDEDWVQRMIGSGTPEPAARLLLGLFQAARRGDFATTDPTLSELIGRRPQTIRATLE
ncbi:NmrA family NAD(P)-binding protein [Mycobacterium sp. 1245805.9]|uniref:NmrA family NAD(P)-binding protein n=1 Tax=Mycobacterium sp. 1245805.9 TaxID=1856862 RepID=UPI0007FCF909|nr:NmrA family NAD(P)-binding protein [Mycobacterium sp. 1245805.9]OBI94166.1 NAD(P)-dependent oxidoreductase [Mycobacterium sp. 1245805.9]